MKICTLQLMELGNIGIPMPSAECMGLYRGGLLYFVIRTTLLLGCAAVVVKRTFYRVLRGSHGWFSNHTSYVPGCKPRSWNLCSSWVAVGNNRFGYFGYFEDASFDLEHFFSPDNTDGFEDNFKIGKEDPTADPPKVAKDYTGKIIGEVAAESVRLDISIASEEGINLIDFLADKQGPKLLGAFQLFAVAVGAAEDLDFTFLQELQDEFHDLVPNHDRDGEDVEKYFRRVSFPNGMCWFDLFKCLAHSQFGSGVCECA